MKIGFEKRIDKKQHNIKDTKVFKILPKLLAVLLIVQLVGGFLFLPSKINQARAAGTNYYVANAGNDSCDGKSQAIGSSGACAWKTIAKVNSSSFLPGDSILFNRGDTWREQLNLPSSGSAGNPITISAYGGGNKPKIYGSIVPSSWTSESYTPSYVPFKVQGPPTIGNGTTSATSTFTSAPTQNNLEIAWLGCSSSTAGISSAGISGFSLASSASMGTTNGFTSIWYKVAGSGESTGVTATITGGSGCNLIIEEWANIAASSPLDKTASTNDTGSGVTSRSSGTTPTTTVASELVITGVGTLSSTTNRSWSNSFNFEYQNDAYYVVYAGSKAVSLTGAYESTLSWTTSRRASGAIATFKGSSGSSQQLYYASQSSDPGYIWFIDTGSTIHNGNKVSSKDSLLHEYDWWFDSSNNQLYVNSATDPITRYTSVEVTDTTRVRGIFWTGNGNSYITIDGFEIAFLTGVGIVARGDYWIVANNTIHHLGNQTGGHSYGIELQTTTNSRLANNIVHDTYRSCYYVVTSYDPYINQNNTIESNTGYDCLTGIILAVTEASNVTFASTTIRYNNIYYTAGFTAGSNSYGIDIVGLSGHPADSYQIYYNTISTKKAAIEIGGYVTNTSIYNNSIISSEGKGISIEGSGNSGITLKNNLIAGAGLYGLYVPDKTQIATSDYNLWYAPSGTGYANINGINYTSSDFVAYKSATGWDTNGLWQDPIVFSASTPDFTLQSASFAINAGVSIGLTTDYAGNSVPKCSNSLPDIGAYEYQETCPVTGGASVPGYSNPPIPGPNGLKCTINNGDASTKSRDVTLILEAGPNVRYYSVSEKPDLKGAGFDAFEPEVINKPFALSVGDGLKTVYAQFMTAYNRLSDIVSDDIILDTSTIATGTENQPTQPAQSTHSNETPKDSSPSIVDGDIFKSPNNPDVYIVKLIRDKKFKRLILNPNIFNQYKHLKWENIKTVSQEVLDQYFTSDLVRASKDTKVYELYANGDVGEKKWIKTLNDFISLGYDWNAVYVINNYERNSYISGLDLISSQ